MNELALFAGAGGGILGGSLLGWKIVCAVECEPYPASVLCARQNEGILPPFPIWDDVCTFDGKPWRGIVDVVSGGFPCQDISSAGGGGGITGSRSGLWKEMARIIGEVRPQYAFIENSPMLTIRGLDTVLCDLAAMGFNANWGVVSAADVGAPHLRERIWILAHAMRGSGSAEPWEQQGQRAEIVDRSGERSVAHSTLPDDATGCDSQRGKQMQFRRSGSRTFVAHSNSDSQPIGTINAEPVCEPNFSNTNNGRRWRREIRGEVEDRRFEFHGENEQMAYANNGSIKTWSKPRILEQSDFERQTNGHPHGSTQANVAHANSTQRQGNECAERGIEEPTDISQPSWWASEPGMG